MGPRFSQNRAGSGSTIKPVWGPHVFHTMKIGISEDKCGNSKKGQNVTNSPPNGWRALFVKFVKTQAWIYARHSWVRTHLDRVLLLQK